MPRKQKTKPTWEVGLQGAVREGRRGWSVVNFRGKVRLRLQFPKKGTYPADQQAFLPYEWAPESINPILQICNRIYGPVMSGEATLRSAIDVALAESDHKRHICVAPWVEVAAAFKRDKLEMGNQIKEKTFDASYNRYLKVALHLLKGRQQPQTGKDLVEAVLRHKRTNQKTGKKYGEPLLPWIDQPKSRLECCLALKKFLEYAVHEARHANCWLVSDRDYMKLRGTDCKRREKAVLSDDEVMILIDSLPETWGNVVKLGRIYGLRPWETSCLAVRKNPAGDWQMFCTEGKVYSTRGLKKTNDPRWLIPIPINGNDFDLVETMRKGYLALPIGNDGEPIEIDGASLGKALRRLPMWKRLVLEKKKQGEWLRPYSLRDTYSLKGTEYGLHDTNISRAMGHTVAVHQRSYRTTGFEQMMEDFKKVQSNKKRNRE